MKKLQVIDKEINKVFNVVSINYIDKTAVIENKEYGHCSQTFDNLDEVPTDLKLTGLTKDQLAHIGGELGYVPKAAISKAGRFLSGMQGKLKHWNYDETINFGDMHKVLSVIKYLQTL